ncbi:MAG: hypothetical protein KDB27_14350 [Planctomycetales bacterium]|nr:hypothetical protein [Planctomycetales bacterium]
MTHTRFVPLIAVTLLLFISNMLTGQPQPQPIRTVANVRGMTSDVAKAHLPCELDGTIYYGGQHSLSFYVGQGREFVLVQKAQSFCRPGRESAYAERQTPISITLGI